MQQNAVIAAVASGNECGDDVPGLVVVRNGKDRTRVCATEAATDELRALLRQQLTGLRTVYESPEPVPTREHNHK